MAQTRESKDNTRREFLKLTIAAAAAAATGCNLPEPFPKPKEDRGPRNTARPQVEENRLSLKESMALLASSSNVDDQRRAAKRVIEHMQQTDMSTFVCMPEGKIGIIDNTIEPKLSHLSYYAAMPVVCRMDSPHLRPLLELLPKGSINDTQYVILSPNVVSNHDEEAGLYLGDGIVMIDTRSHGIDREPATFAPVLRHEDVHAGQAKGMSVLAAETDAHLGQLDSIEWMLGRQGLNEDQQKQLGGMRLACKKRLASADFIWRFDPDGLGGIYPSEFILAGDLIKANPRGRALVNAMKVDPGRYSGDDAALARELRAASRVAAIVYDKMGVSVAGRIDLKDMDFTEKRRTATEALYSIIDKTDSSDLEKANAASAIAALWPEVIHVRTSPDWASSKQRNPVLAYDSVASGPTEYSGGINGLPPIDRFERIYAIQANHNLLAAEIRRLYANAAPIPSDGIRDNKLSYEMITALERRFGRLEGCPERMQHNYTIIDRKPYSDDGKAPPRMSIGYQHPDVFHFSERFDSDTPYHLTKVDEFEQRDGVWSYQGSIFQWTPWGPHEVTEIKH
jgi:hypothetical protein